MRKLLILFLPIFIISCDKIGGNSLKGWYTDLDKVATTSGFNRINQAIDNYECIYTTGYSHNYDKYATRDLFFKDGRWSSSSANYGTCRFLPEVGQQIYVVHILNENTLTYYYGWLYDPNYVPSSAEILGKVYAGRNIGELVYYDEFPRTYTYTELDNKLYVSNGDIFTVSSTGLIKDGTNGIMSKYNPSTRF